jgi:hypothetical protein
MAWARATIALVVAAALGLVLVSGGSGKDPRTPPALPGLPAPFLGTAVAGSGGMTAAVDAYGDVVDLRAPGPAGRALIDNPSDRQAAGSVAADTGIVPRVRVGAGPWLPPWRADAVSQRYLPGTNVVRTVARFGRARVTMTVAAGTGLAVSGTIDGAERPAAFRFGVAEPRLREACAEERRGRVATLICGGAGGPGPLSTQARAIRRRAAGTDRRWLSRARPLGRKAPGWADAMYRRSLLTLRALTDRRTGAVAAGARDSWAYVWPRDAATAALAFAAAGYEEEARGVTGFLDGLDLSAAARFDGEGAPVPGRAAQGDAPGWVAVADAQAPDRGAWRNRADYREGPAGEYLGNAIAARAPLAAFEASHGFVRAAGDPGSGLDSAAAWAVRPFARPALYPTVRRTLLLLAAHQTRFGITPGEGWPGVDPWTAPTAWSAWAFAALDDRRQALRLLADLRRAATPAGELPERVGARTGIPRSTTPLAWSHAFAVLTLRELWAPSRERSRL